MGLWSAGTLFLLYFISTVLLFYMTHIQTIHSGHQDDSLHPYDSRHAWWLPSSNDRGEFDLSYPHRRINTLLRSNTMASLSSSSETDTIRSDDPLFPPSVQLPVQVASSSHPYRHRIDYYVQRPKLQHSWQWNVQTQRNHPDYGNIHRIRTTPSSQSQSHHHNSTTSPLFITKISTNDYDMYELYRTQLIDNMDVPEMSYYYHQYDDLDFSSLNHYDSDDPTAKVPYNEEDDPASCERPTWGYDNSKINCNTIHELYPPLVDGLIQNSIQPLGHGYYRDTYLIQQPMVGAILTSSSSSTSTTTHEDHIVMKQLRYEHPQSRQYQYEMNLEAMIMETTTASTVTSYIYGHCSTTLLVESLQDVTHSIVPFHKQYQPIRGRVSDIVLHSLEAQQAKRLHATNSTSEPYSFNPLTVVEKLQYARQMSQALVEMHGYVGGVIVHDDVHPDQWLLSHDKTRIVLNDMNNAVILLWSRQYNKYCTFWDHYGGDYRAPEMYQEGGTYTTNELADVYPMGNLIYSLITGLYPYHNITDNDETVIQQLTMNPNVRPYIHPKLRQMDHFIADSSPAGTMTHFHSEEDIEMYIYHRLIHIMDMCHQMAPNDRPSIFQVHDYLIQTQTVVDDYLHNKYTARLP